MATLIAYQNGDFTGATTWKQPCTGTGAQQLTSGSITAATSSYVYSPTFTITNGEVIEGVVIRISNINSTSGTVSVALSDNNGVTATREVTMNATNLEPGVGAFVFFKFDTPLTADGGNDYRLGVRQSGANVNIFRDATTANWIRLFRSSTTASASATDNFIISGEQTGAGSNTPITVTMDSTANTSYGFLDICPQGTLSFGTSVSTNYYLRLAGNLVVSSNGTLNIGTSGTRIPSTSTATLEFNCASNVQFGLEALNGSTVNIYGAEKANTKVLLTADANSGQAVITVEDTTGWATSDTLWIASTTRTASQTEKRTISSIGSSTQATMTANLTATHAGVAPYQGEVINVTRNVKIRGTLISLCGYVNCAATSSFTADNAEFFFLGSGTGNKRGIDSGMTTGSFAMRFCSAYDFNAGARFFSTAGASNASIVEDCVFGGASGTNTVTISATTGVPELRRNWFIASDTQTIALLDTGLTFTDNRVCGLSITLSENGEPGTISGNVIHSGLAGIIANANILGTILNTTIWRCDTGINFLRGPAIFENANIYHCGTTSLQFTTTTTANSVAIYFINSTFDGGSGQSLSQTARHFFVPGTTQCAGIVFENCDFGQTTAATGFALWNQSAPGYADFTFRNCDIAETLPGSGQGNLYAVRDLVSAIKFDKLNSTSGNHRAYKRFGYAGSDQSVYRTASPSEVLVPNSASGKLPSGSKKFGVASGNDATVSVWVRKSSTYNGAEPRLILKRNIVGGVSSDQVLATLSGGTEEWLELTASTPTVTDDCVLEVYVDCDGTAGTVNVDDYSIT